MHTLQKLETLKEVHADSAALDRILGKILEAVLGEYQFRLQRYEGALKAFEERYEMDSEAFYQRFEAGKLGDDMDFFEWAGLYELHEDLLKKIQLLEQAV